MTFDEILQALAVLTAEVQKLKDADGGGGHIDPPTDTVKDPFDVVAGPDDDGRVQFGALKAAHPEYWVLSKLTIKRAEALGKPLTDKQRFTIMHNAGCDDKGNDVPAGPNWAAFPGAPDGEGHLIGGLSYRLKYDYKYPALKFLGKDWVEAEAFPLKPGVEITINARNDSSKQILAGLEQNLTYFGHK